VIEAIRQNFRYALRLWKRRRRSPPSPSSRSRSASAPTRRCSASSTPCWLI